MPVDFFLIRERGLCVAFYLDRTSGLGLAGWLSLDARDIGRLVVED